MHSIQILNLLHTLHLHDDAEETKFSFSFKGAQRWGWWNGAALWAYLTPIPNSQHTSPPPHSSNNEEQRGTSSSIWVIYPLRIATDSLGGRGGESLAHSQIPLVLETLLTELFRHSTQHSPFYFPQNGMRSASFSLVSRVMMVKVKGKSCPCA
jgi:hypothetical protein